MALDEKPPEFYAGRVLRMVHELHCRGYQRLRIMPGMSPSGCYWRCFITPASNILAEHGAWAAVDDESVGVRYTSGMMGGYFDWRDATAATPKRLATLFIKRFPHISEAGRGSDWAYAGWYMEMLRWAARGRFPVSYSDGGTGYELRWLPTWGTRELDPLPMPPPGEASGRLPWRPGEASLNDLPMGLGALLEAAQTGNPYLGSPDAVRLLVRRFQDEILYRQDEEDFIGEQVLRMADIFLGENSGYVPMAGSWNTVRGGLPNTIRIETGISADGRLAVESFFHRLADRSIRLCDHMRNIEALADEAVRILLGLPGESNGLLA